VKLKRQLSLNLPRPLLLPSKFLIADDEDNIIVDDDVVFGRNRQAERFGKLLQNDDDELSDYVKLRLALARAKAMQKYQEKWG